MAQKNSKTRVMIDCKACFAHVFEPKAVAEGQPAKYSMACVIPKSDTATLKKVTDAIEAAKEAGKAKWGGKIPPNLKTPLRDGDIDRPDDEAFQNCMFFNASSLEAPQIVDRHVRLITDPLEFGSGDFCKVSVNIYPYEKGASRGIAAGLGNIQKVKDGERISGRVSALSEFTSLGDDEADPFGGEVPSFLA